MAAQPGQRQVVVACAAVAAPVAYILYKHLTQCSSTSQQTASQTLPPYTIREPVRSESAAISAQIHESFDTGSISTGEFRWSNVELWQHHMDSFFDNPDARGLVAYSNADNSVLGSVFADMSDEIVGMGPFSVSTKYGSGGLAKKMIEQLLQVCKSAGRTKFGLLITARNYAAFSLYFKLGFDVAQNSCMLVGELPETFTSNTDTSTVVSALSTNDAHDCNELHKKVVGVSRINDITRMANRTDAISVVARDASNRVLGYCTDVSSADGHWVWDTLPTFQSLYIHADKRLKALNDKSKHIFVKPPYKRRGEIEWLMQHKLRVLFQSMTMYINHNLPAQSEYAYSASAWY